MIFFKHNSSRKRIAVITYAKLVVYQQGLEFGLKRNERQIKMYYEPSEYGANNVRNDSTLSY